MKNKILSIVVAAEYQSSWRIIWFAHIKSMNVLEISCHELKTTIEYNIFFFFLIVSNSIWAINVFSFIFVILIHSYIDKQQSNI